MQFPFDLWNLMLGAAAAAVEANKEEARIVVDSVRVLMVSQFYSDLVPEAKTYAENSISDFLYKKINDTAPVEEVVTMKKADFDTLAKNIEESVLKKVAGDNAVMKELVSSLGKKDYAAQIEFDAADVMEEPAIFFTYAIGMGVMDDTRNGIAIPPPYKRPFHFVHMYRHERMGRDRKEFINLSACHVSSRKEAEYLRNHSLCGIKFFEDINKVKTIDVQMQDRLVEAHNEISRLSEHEMVTRAKSEGVPYSSDMGTMRKELVFKIAAKRMIQAGAKQKEVVEAIAKTTETIKEVSAVH